MTFDSRVQPPGTVERVRAASALVVAPHYDDEIFGCGGLLAQLTAVGAAVRVLFLTDSAGGVEAVDDRDDYRTRRREEARAVARLMGFAGVDRLELPDGALARHLEPAAAGIRRAILSQRPELLLAPSPLEVSPDHRAAFAALHEALAPSRPGGELAEALAGLTILLYEINHPAYPDLLVDVTAELPRIEEAVGLYTSQLERHGYLAAAVGLRRFRTLSLPPEVEAAEGYRRLSVGDFTTHSPAQLVRRLGGAPEVLEVTEGPRVSVVVRTKDRPELLAEALESLAAGSYRRVEVVLVNDGGEPPEPPSDYPLPIVRVDLPENRGRAAAANAGIATAGGEYVAFLDDDDLAAPEHLATLAGAVAGAGVRVAYTDAAVAVYELAGDEGDGAGWACRERRLPYSRDFDPDLLLLDNYIPTNTLLIERALFDEVGPFDEDFPFFEDWDFLIRLAAVTPFHHLPRVTCEYRHFRGGGHHILGERPRQRSDFLAMKAKVYAKHAARLGPETLARAVDTLRAERVEALEEIDSLRRSERELSEETRELEERYHRVNGELAAARGDNEAVRAELAKSGAELRRLYADLERHAGELARRDETLQGLYDQQESRDAELQRLYDEEAELRAVVEDQTAHLGRTYAEIERLTAELAKLEAARAVRLQRWWQGKRHG